MKADSLLQSFELTRNTYIRIKKGKQKNYTNYTLNLTQNLTVFRRAGDRLVTGGFSEEGGMRSEMSRECHQEVTEAMLSVCGSRRHLRGRIALQANLSLPSAIPGRCPGLLTV